MLSESYKKDLNHFTWCALIATGMAIFDNKINSTLSEHLFIMKWLSVAGKRKQFAKSIQGELQWLLNEGRRKGVSANLKFKIEYLYSTCCNDVSMLSDFFRFTHAVDELKEHGWECLMMTHNKWKKIREKPLDISGNVVFLNEIMLQTSFSTTGVLLTPFYIRVFGDFLLAKNEFEKYGLKPNWIQNANNGINHFYFDSAG